MPCTETYKEHIMYTFHGFCKVVIRNAAKAIIDIGITDDITLLDNDFWKLKISPDIYAEVIICAYLHQNQRL